jgi:hypothetical protein
MKVRLSTLRFHPVSITSTPLRAKQYAPTSNLRQASQKNLMADLNALNRLQLFKLEIMRLKDTRVSFTIN